MKDVVAGMGGLIVVAGIILMALGNGLGLGVVLVGAVLLILGVWA